MAETNWRERLEALRIKESRGAAVPITWEDLAFILRCTTQSLREYRNGKTPASRIAQRIAKREAKYEVKKCPE